MNGDKPKWRRLTVLIGEELHRKAKLKSAKTDKPMAEVMREALQEWAEEDPSDEEIPK